MSRIGKKPIIIPAEVKVINGEQNLVVAGPKGELSIVLPTEVTVSQKDSSIFVKGADDNPNFGKVRAEIANMIKGVTSGWSKILEVVGTGYRASTDGKSLTLNLGFSHPVVIIAPKMVNFSVSGNKITIEGIDKQLVGQIAAKIKSIKKPDSYKGKGIRYEGEIIRKKQGKAAKGAVS